MQRPQVGRYTSNTGTVFNFVSSNPLPLNSQLRKAHTGTLPERRKSRLLAPTENVNAPEGFVQPCAVASQIERSYRDRVSVTVSLWPARRSTSVKPRSTFGGSPALEGKCR